MKRVLASAVSTEWKTVAKGWDKFIRQLERDTGIGIDSIYKHNNPEQFIEGYRDGKTYEIEVTAYHDGTYEVMYDNIHEI